VARKHAAVRAELTGSGFRVLGAQHPLADGQQRGVLVADAGINP
jgi:hypothetical protein